MKSGDLITLSNQVITKNTSSNYLNKWVKSSNKIGVIIDIDQLIAKILIEGKIALVFKQEIEVIYEY